MNTRLIRSLFTLLLLVFAAAASAQTGAVSGRVIDQATRGALPGAAIVVDGSSLSAVSDRDGRFRIAGIPPGPVTLIVTYIGRADTRMSLTAMAGTTEVVVEIDERGEDANRYNESVVVSAPMLADAQARALNVRRFGDFSGIGEIEAVTVDDELGFVYYADEAAGIHK
jgi:hypothetical protein